MMTDMQLISLGLTLLAIFTAMYGNRKSVGGHEVGFGEALS